jgi:predicted metal-binding membrane protein
MVPTASSATPPDGRTERLVRRDRAAIATALAVAVAVLGGWVVSGAGTGMSALQATPGLMHLSPGGMEMTAAPGWTPPYLALGVAMWWAMMVAMMLPSAAPIILLHARTLRHAARRGTPVPDIAALSFRFALGYALAWLGFSVVATLLQVALVQGGLVSPMLLAAQSRWLGAGLLLLAALWQLTPAKRACLSACRAPAEFLARIWRPGRTGALVMGLDHGARCLGCCWALMALLFVGGVMNLFWIAALSAVVLVEKLGPWEATPRLLGVGLLAAAIAVAAG